MDVARVCWRVAAPTALVHVTSIAPLLLPAYGTCAPDCLSTTWTVCDALAGLGRLVLLPATPGAEQPLWMVSSPIIFALPRPHTTGRACGEANNILQGYVSFGLPSIHSPQGALYGFAGLL